MNDNIGLDLLDFLPSGMKKSDDVVAAVFSNENGAGAVANALTHSKTLIDYLSRQTSPYDYEGYELELLFKAFSNMQRRFNETDAVLRRRFEAMIARKSDTPLNTKIDYKHFAEGYFSGCTCHVCEYTDDIENTLLENGDFELEGSSAVVAWTLSGGAAISGDARYVNKKGCALSGGAASQTVELDTHLYVLHFFHKGAVSVSVSDGTKWACCDEGNAQFLQWQNTKTTVDFAGADWQNDYIFFHVPNEATNITITFEGAGQLDYVRLFERLPNPSFTLCMCYSGFTAKENTLHLAKGQNLEPDPIEGVDYTKEDYFEKSFITGLSGSSPLVYLQDFFASFIPLGVQLFVERLEIIEDEA